MIRDEIDKKSKIAIKSTNNIIILKFDGIAVDLDTSNLVIATLWSLSDSVKLDGTSKLSSVVIKSTCDLNKKEKQKFEVKLQFKVTFRIICIPFNCMITCTIIWRLNWIIYRLLLTYNQKQ